MRNPVPNRRRSRASGLRLRLLKRCGGVVVAAMLAASCMSGGGVVEGLKVVNDTVYDLEVRLTDDARDGWTPLGRTRRGETTTHHHVDDRGDVWIFRFEHPSAVEGGELRVTRAALERDDWEVHVPEEVERTLEREGVEPSRET